MNKGKCPKCESTITRVHFEGVGATPSPMNPEGWKALSFMCPSCHTILGVQIDPISIQSSILNQVSSSARSVQKKIEEEASRLRHQIDDLSRKVK